MDNQRHQNPPVIVVAFLERLRQRLGEVEDQLVPSELFDSFAYTQTGRNFSHPRVWGLATLAAWDVVPDGGIVEVDSRLNEAGQKFQPDLLVRDREGRDYLAVDIESPNSSDARLVPKDVDAYLNWIGRRGGMPFPYLVITMLPNRNVATDEWDFRRGTTGLIPPTATPSGTAPMPTGTACSRTRQLSSQVVTCSSRTSTDRTLTWST